MFVTNANLFAQNQISITSILNRIKSMPAKNFEYHLSMPSRDEYGTSTWNIKYYIILEDTVLQNFCDRSDSKQFIRELVELLKDDNYAWQVNLMLFRITKINAIELQVYAPNKVDEWGKERKEKDINFWRTYKP